MYSLTNVMSYDFFVVKGLIGEHASFCFFLGGCLARESVAFHAVESMLRCLSYWGNHDSLFSCRRRTMIRRR